MIDEVQVKQMNLEKTPKEQREPSARLEFPLSGLSRTTPILEGLNKCEISLLILPGRRNIK